MKVFLTGATGYIGSAVLQALARGGHEVTALVRDAAKGARVSQLGARAVEGDLDDQASYASAAEGHDAYVLTAFEGSDRGPDIDRRSLESFLGIAAAGPSPAAVIYTSGVWVLGNTSTPAAEDAELDPPPSVTWRPAHEQLVLAAADAGVRAVVVRPGIVYGESRGIVGDMLRDAANGLIRVVGDGRNHWPLIYTRDLGELYRLLLERDDAAGIFHANDEGDETVLELVEAMSDQAHHRPEIRYMPVEEAPRRWEGGLPRLR